MPRPEPTYTIAQLEAEVAAKFEVPAFTRDDAVRLVRQNVGGVRSSGSEVHFSSSQPQLHAHRMLERMHVVLRFYSRISRRWTGGDDPRGDPRVGAKPLL
jgi:hypothetical protein